MGIPLLLFILTYRSAEADKNDFVCPLSTCYTIFLSAGCTGKSERKHPYAARTGMASTLRHLCHILAHFRGGTDRLFRVPFLCNQHRIDDDSGTFSTDYRPCVG